MNLENLIKTIIDKSARVKIKDRVEKGLKILSKLDPLSIDEKGLYNLTQLVLYLQIQKLDGYAARLIKKNKLDEELVSNLYKKTRELRDTAFSSLYGVNIGLVSESRGINVVRGILNNQSQLLETRFELARREIESLDPALSLYDIDTLKYFSYKIKNTKKGGKFYDKILEAIDSKIDNSMNIFKKVNSDRAELVKHIKGYEPHPHTLKQNSPGLTIDYNRQIIKRAMIFTNNRYLLRELKDAMDGVNRIINMQKEYSYMKENNRDFYRKEAIADYKNEIINESKKLKERYDYLGFKICEKRRLSLFKKFREELSKSFVLPIKDLYNYLTDKRFAYWSTIRESRVKVRAY